MPMPVENLDWLQAHQQLSAISSLLQQANSAEHFQNAIQKCRQLNNQLQSLTDDNPGSAVAQLSFAFDSIPRATSRTIKSWVLLALWSRLKHWPKSRRDTLGCCLLLASYQAPENKTLGPLRLAANLKKQQIGGLFTTVLAGTFHQQQKRHPWQVHRDSPLVTLAIELGQLLCPDDGPLQALEQVVATRITYTTEEYELAELTLLAHLAPDIYLCGRLAVDTLSRHWLLCHADGEHYQALQFWPEQQELTEHLSAQPLDSLTIMPPSTLATQQWLAKITIPPFDEQVIPTPSSLLANSVLEKLRHNDLKAQLKLLEKHPLLVQILLDIASDSNRKQTLIHRLRHALAIFGQEQLPFAIARAELLQYLQLQASNQHSWLLQLQHTLHYCLMMLGRFLPQPLSLQQAGLIATCCSAPLWHHPTLQAVPLSKMQQEQLLLGQLCQQYLIEPVRSQRLSAALLKHYHLPLWAEAVLSQYQQPVAMNNKKPRELAGLFLRLCWQLTFNVFCYPSNEQISQKLLNILARDLALPSSDSSFWQQELLNAPSLYYPLDN